MYVHHSKKLRKACKTAQLIQNLSGPKSVSIQKFGLLLLRNFARQRANLIHGPWYIGPWYMSKRISNAFALHVPAHDLTLESNNGINV